MTALTGLGHASAAVVYPLALLVLVLVAGASALTARRAGRRALARRLNALGARLGAEPPSDGDDLPGAVAELERLTGSAAQAVAGASTDVERLRHSLDAMPQGVVICDVDNVVVYRNARATALMSSRHGEALAAQAVIELLGSAWHEGHAERTLDLYGPPRRTLSVRAHLIDDGPTPLGAIAMIEDVSERRRLEEIRRDFVANVSHELKTPIGALGLLAETLVAEPDGEVARRLAARIHNEAFRVSRIIDDLLDLSRIESEELPPRDPVLVSLVMSEAVERVRATAEQRDITLVVHDPSPPVAVSGDRRQLVSAMHALVENAVTYSYEGSTVTVSGEEVVEPLLPAQGAPAAGGTAPGAGSTAAGGDGSPGRGTASTLTARPARTRRVVRLSVTDHGVGIPARDLERIFERFYRVDRGRSRDTGGTGLGLSIVRHVASNHHGHVDVESREGEGSTFTLVLPLGSPPPL